MTTCTKSLWHHLIDFLNEGYLTLDSLSDKYGVSVREDNDLITLKYGINSPKIHWVTRACRGTVLSKTAENSFRIQAVGFERFYNLGEAEEVQKHFNWDNYRVEEKWDGSLIILHWYEPEACWVVSTSGSPRASGSPNPHYNGTFEDLYWESFRRNDNKVEDLNPDYIYIQELITPWNRVVVDYGKDTWCIRDLAKRDASTLEEVSLGETSVEEANIEFLRDSLKKTSGKEREGFILVDGSGNRIKLKSPNYVQLHHVLNNGTPDLAKLYREGELSEFLVYFPEYNRVAERMLRGVEEDIFQLENLVSEFRGDYKEFALKHQENSLFGLSMLVIRKGVTPREAVVNQSEKRFKEHYI